VLIAGAVALALMASAHAVIYKRESRSAALWAIVIWLLPAAGPTLYVLFGVNRVRRRAARLRGEMVRLRPTAELGTADPDGHFAPLARLIGTVCPRPLLPGNGIEALVDADEAYPAMLDAIDSAEKSIGLASYIFHGDGIGERFVDALARAVHRGVEVRVLIDDVDVRFSRTSAAKALRERNVPLGVFNPPVVPARVAALHLRNHRKILVVDGALGFTGGMNIDRRYWGPDAYHDTHFSIRGPVVSQLSEVFADDWQFVTGERLEGPRWFSSPRSGGPTLARCIEDGPDESVLRLRWAMIGGLNAAQRSARILTPYFVPDTAVISALNAAALRGVEVDIVLPQRSDLPHVDWAATGQLWQVLEHGCRVWKDSGSFDHSKLLVVDSAWTLLGSANWDSRSLRLNFELNVECYCTEFGGRMEKLVLAKRAGSRQVTLADLDARPFAVKLRDGTARLLAPFL
jgi:cardiolipin synthase